MFDDIDYQSIIKYIEMDLLPYINSEQAGGVQMIGYPSSFISLGLVGKIYSKNPNDFFFNMTTNLTSLIASLIGISPDFLEKNIIPIYKFFRGIFEKIWGEEKSIIASYLLFISITAKKIKRFLPYIFNIFEIKDEEAQNKIKETLDSIADFAYITSLVIVGINVIARSYVKSTESVIVSQYNLIQMTIKRSANSIQNKIYNIFKAKKVNLPVNFEIGSQGINLTDIKAPEEIKYSLLTLEGGEGEMKDNIIKKATQIVNKYLKGVSLSKLINELYLSYNFPNIPTQNKPIGQFTFNKNTGRIETNINVNKTVWLTHRKKIKMVCKGMEIMYLSSDGMEISSTSYFNAKPIHLAICLAWMEKQTPSKPLDDSEYLVPILGNSPIGILKILSEKTNEPNKKIQYEILKTLGFKKNNLGKISPYEIWIANLSPDKKNVYSKYLNSQVENILKKIVIQLNGIQSNGIQ